ncbi:hypothetical protein IFM89_032673 [Coptis chinensis]|uniref:B-like cyclin n=1 Tax=Coptis chinensis TaxID=261450 RepID=A0A835M244_9MAGN|nr:hypothetical protein IFM89_032673 [Coptis chinensis]
MRKENMDFEPTVRITRARAAACHASGIALPPKPSTRQVQKAGLRGNSKRPPSDENSSVPVTGQNKRRTVLKDVTNVLCENSYKSCMNVAKIQVAVPLFGYLMSVFLALVSENVICHSSVLHNLKLVSVNAACLQPRNCKQALKSHVKKDSRVAPAVSEEAQQIKDKGEREKVEETDVAAVSVEIEQNKDNVEMKTAEESDKMGIVESPKIMISVRKEENLPVQNVKNSITVCHVADTQPWKQASEKPVENLVLSYKDLDNFSENPEGGPKIINIDSDHQDPLMCSLYAPDIYKNLRVAELIRRPTSNFMETMQRDITQTMRGILIDWLVEVTEEYKLTSDTLYLTVYLIDRFLSHNYIVRQKLQLLGITCMLIASKYEEICAPRVEDFCFITDNTYTRMEVLEMESKVLNNLEFQISTPTIKTFVRRFLRAAQASYKAPSVELEYLANYLAELTMVEYAFLKFLPSLVAASAIFLARWTLDQSSHPWNPTLEHYTSYKALDLNSTVSALQNLQMNYSGCPLNAIRDKYRQEKFKSVAALSSPEVFQMLFQP